MNAHAYTLHLHLVARWLSSWSRQPTLHECNIYLFRPARPVALTVEAVGRRFVRSEVVRGCHRLSAAGSQEQCSQSSREGLQACTNSAQCKQQARVSRLMSAGGVSAQARNHCTWLKSCRYASTPCTAARCTPAGWHTHVSADATASHRRERCFQR